MLLGSHLRDHEHVWGKQKTWLFRNPMVRVGEGKAQENNDKEEREMLLMANSISSYREAKQALAGQGDH